MAKWPKAAAGYLTADQVGTSEIGTKCSKCRDFIRSTSECLITIDSKVSGERGTCTQFLKGQPYDRAKPLLLIPKEAVGYIEGDAVPTFCGRCEYYVGGHGYKGKCEIVEGSIDYGGCCNSYTAK